MSRDIELSNAWLEAYLLKKQGKRINLVGGKPLDGALEEEMFEEADKRIDASIAEKRKQIIPESLWEKDWKEAEKQLEGGEK